MISVVCDGDEVCGSESAVDMRANLKGANRTPSGYIAGEEWSYFALLSTHRATSAILQNLDFQSRKQGEPYDILSKAGFIIMEQMGKSRVLEDMRRL